MPLYYADVEAAGVPQSVADLRNAVRDADALLIATPEYNHGVPGVLKNPIDWLSRPPDDQCAERQSRGDWRVDGMTGTAGSQSQLRQAFVFTNTYALLPPEVLVARAY